MEEHNDNFLPNSPKILLFAIILRSLEEKLCLMSRKTRDAGCLLII
jgi:hypothetical protein